MTSVMPMPMMVISAERLMMSMRLPYSMPVEGWKLMEKNSMRMFKQTSSISSSATTAQVTLERAIFSGTTSLPEDSMAITTAMITHSTASTMKAGRCLDKNASESAPNPSTPTPTSRQATASAISTMDGM